MPSTYAHFRFGRDVLNRITDKKTKTLIEKNIALFDVGLHGPDFFFYSAFFVPSRVSRLGHEIHYQPGRVFFENAAHQIQSQNLNERALAYIFGVLCHFAFDSLAHPYVAEKMKASGIAHAEIEGSFESYLMQMDGLESVSHNPAYHIRVDQENAKILACFYPPAAPKQISRAIRCMRICCNLLVAPKQPMRSIVFAFLKLTFHYDQLYGMVSKKSPDPNCSDSDQKLFALYEQSLPLALSLIQKFCERIEANTVLGEEFDRTFEA